MTRSANILCSLTASLTLVAGASAPAEAARAHFTFNDIEYGEVGSDAATFGKTVIAKAIPVGMTASQAAELLREAGARCKVGSASVRCTRNSFEAVENVLHDVAWTIDMRIQNGIVTGMTARRDSIGS